MKQVMVRFELTNGASEDTLHEALCKAVHEGDMDLLETVSTWITDIEIKDVIV